MPSRCRSILIWRSVRRPLRACSNCATRTGISCLGTPCARASSSEVSRVPFSSFQKGIHRARQMRGPAALSLFTTPPREGRPAPYADEVDEESGLILYHYRAGRIDQPDNRALRAAHELRTPLIYFKGIAPSRYFPIAPVFVAENDPSERAVLLEVGVPLVDVQPGGPGLAGRRALVRTPPGQGSTAPAAVPTRGSPRVPASLHDLRATRTRARASGAHRGRPVS